MKNINIRTEEKKGMAANRKIFLLGLFAVFALALFSSTVYAATVVSYPGTVLPQVAGWTRQSVNFAPVTETIEFNEGTTVYHMKFQSPGTSGRRIDYSYQLDNGDVSFIQFRAKVLDGALTFSPSILGAPSPVHRNILRLNPANVGWEVSLLGVTDTSVNLGSYHTYLIITERTGVGLNEFRVTLFIDGTERISAITSLNENAVNGVVFFGQTSAGQPGTDAYIDFIDVSIGSLSFPSPCGDGNFNVIEECDDGNTNNGDGCDRYCRTEGCGNGHIDERLNAPIHEVEQCDDGDLNSGDGCSGGVNFIDDAACRVES